MSWRILWFVGRSFSAAISDKKDGLPVVATSGEGDNGIISSLMGLILNGCCALTCGEPLFAIFLSCYFFFSDSKCLLD